MQAAQAALDAAALRRLAQQRRQLLAGAVKTAHALAAQQGRASALRGDGSGADPACRHRRPGGRSCRAERLSAPGALGGRGRRRRSRRRGGCPGEPCGRGNRNRKPRGNRPRRGAPAAAGANRRPGPRIAARLPAETASGTAPPPGRRESTDDADAVGGGTGAGRPGSGRRGRRGGRRGSTPRSRGAGGGDGGNTRLADEARELRRRLEWPKPSSREHGSVTSWRRPWRSRRHGPRTGNAARKSWPGNGCCGSATRRRGEVLLSEVGCTLESWRTTRISSRFPAHFEQGFRRRTGWRTVFHGHLPRHRLRPDPHRELR